MTVSDYTFVELCTTNVQIPLPPRSQNRTPPIQQHTNARTIRPPLGRITQRQPLARHRRLARIIRFIDTALSRRTPLARTPAAALAVQFDAQPGAVAQETGC